MNKQTLKALQGSIKKWELIVAGDGLDNGTDNCPLCVRFYSRDCKGCPVRAKTGESECCETPYIDWKNTHNNGGMVYFPLVANTPEKKRAAREELRFLKSLLP